MTNVNIQKTFIAPFGTSLGNGKKAGQLLAQAIDHVITERDTTVIVKLINAAFKKGDTSAMAKIKLTFGAVFVGAKIKVNKDKTTHSIQIKEATLNNKAVSSLHDLVKNEVSLRGSKWNEALVAKDTDRKQFNAKSFVATCAKQDLETLAQMKKIIAAAEKALKKVVKLNLPTKKAA